LFNASCGAVALTRLAKPKRFCDAPVGRGIARFIIGNYRNNSLTTIGHYAGRFFCFFKESPKFTISPLTTTHE
ncbi:MAG: hypothetical protein IKH31_01020, partial [Clostridia bacterium]|nr:hypothetical protein [Clostridia bacterium]